MQADTLAERDHLRNVRTTLIAITGIAVAILIALLIAYQRGAPAGELATRAGTSVPPPAGTHLLLAWSEHGLATGNCVPGRYYGLYATDLAQQDLIQYYLDHFPSAIQVKAARQIIIAHDETDKAGLYVLPCGGTDSSFCREKVPNQQALIEQGLREHTTVYLIFAVSRPNATDRDLCNCCGGDLGV
jgi:hypothetical protein